jgi:hypothetical protein
MALVDNLFADKHLPVGSALVEMLHIIQYWTKILERSTRPTIHLVVELYYYGHSILLRLLTTDQTKHPFSKNRVILLIIFYLGWSKMVTETMRPFVEKFIESFKRTMVPSSFHYLAAFINPLTGCLTKRCDYPPNWKPDVADADKMEVLLSQHMEKVFYGMTGPEKREMYKQVKKKEAVHQHNLRLKTDEFGNVEILSSSPTDQNNEEIDSEFLDPDWHEYCTEQIKSELNSLKESVAPLQTKIEGSDGVTRKLFDESTEDNIGMICIPIMKYYFMFSLT